MSVYSEQFEKIRQAKGFIAALDQSGGSTPKALLSYGVPESAYSSDSEMFDLVHEMRTRIMTSEAFEGEKVVGAILFEDTMNREVDGKSTADYLWQEKRIVPFLKIDKGLLEARNQAQGLKDIPDLDQLLDAAKAANCFGTKMRSVIQAANPDGVQAVVGQQFEIAAKVIDKGLMPIIEPEVLITAADKQEAEALLRDAILAALDKLPEGHSVMLKLTLPEENNFYIPLVDHPKVLKVVALSGGYSLNEASRRLKQNHQIIASFSRALTELLSVDQSDADFDKTLGGVIDTIYDASMS